MPMGFNIFKIAFRNFVTKLVSKIMFSKKATKIDEIFTVDLTLCSKCQIDSGDFVNFYGLLGKHELYGTKIRLLWNDSTTNLWN